MPKPLDGRRVALGVTGSIACYKALDLASALVQAGAIVDVMMTAAAERFVSPLAFAAIVHRPVATNMFDPRSEIGMDHVAIATRSDLVVVAPATVDAIARMAHGLADDAVTATVLATRSPVVVAPAADAAMMESPATRENLATLVNRGVIVAGPEHGRMASGLTGMGRMVEPEELVGHIRLALGRTGDLVGTRIIVTSGGTREPIDPVRFISNGSSGRMGLALAEAARDRGANVTLISAIPEPSCPVGVDLVRAQRADDMAREVGAAAETADAIVMAAAVADWTPARPSDQKIKKDGREVLTLELERTTDVLASVARPGLIKVGFALETEDLEANARAKLSSKGLDLIVANPAGEEGVGMGTDENRALIIDRSGGLEGVPRMSKEDLAWRILDRVAGQLAGEADSLPG